MKNKELQDILKDYPDDAEIMLTIHEEDEPEYGLLCTLQFQVIAHLNGKDNFIDLEGWIEK